MARRLIEISYEPEEGLTIQVKPHGLHLLPGPARQHLLEARKEFLLALRSLLDRAISRVEEKKEAAQRIRKVEVREEGEASQPPGSGGSAST